MDRTISSANSIGTYLPLQPGLSAVALSSATVKSTSEASALKKLSFRDTSQSQWWMRKKLKNRERKRRLSYMLTLTLRVWKRLKWSGLISRTNGAPKVSRAEISLFRQWKSEVQVLLAAYANSSPERLTSIWIKIFYTLGTNILKSLSS